MQQSEDTTAANGLRLAGRAALVTGSDSGIGQAIATEFAREGAGVAVNFLEDREGARRTADAVRSAGRSAAMVQADQTSEKEVERLFAGAERELGPIDVLVNNAGTMVKGTPVVDLEIADWDRVVRTDLYGPFLCRRRFLRAARDRGRGGRIINVTSIAEEAPRAGQAPYTAAKGGVQNLTRGLALEAAGLGVNVNNLAPGMILTLGMNRDAVEYHDRARERAEGGVALGRPGSPEEIARVAVFLASADAGYVTGSTVTVDGGMMQVVGGEA